MGQAALQRAGVTHGSLLLISDLNDSSADQESLVAEAFALKKAHIPLRIVPVVAAPPDVRIFTTLFGLERVRGAVGVQDDRDRADPSPSPARGRGP